RADVDLAPLALLAMTQELVRHVERRQAQGRHRILHAAPLQLGHPLLDVAHQQPQIFRRGFRPHRQHLPEELELDPGRRAHALTDHTGGPEGRAAAPAMAPRPPTLGRAPANLWRASGSTLGVSPRSPQLELGDVFQDGVDLRQRLAALLLELLDLPLQALVLVPQARDDVSSPTNRFFELP